MLTRLMVSYPRIIEKLKQADCTSRADSPLVNMCSPSSIHSILNALNILSNRCTCSLALTISSGFVMIVVVKPPSVPAMACMHKCENHPGSSFISSSEKKNKGRNGKTMLTMQEKSRDHNLSNFEFRLNAINGKYGGFVPFLYALPHKKKTKERDQEYCVKLQCGTSLCNEALRLDNSLTVFVNNILVKTRLFLKAFTKAFHFQNNLVTAKKNLIFHWGSADRGVALLHIYLSNTYIYIYIKFYNKKYI